MSNVRTLLDVVEEVKREAEEDAFYQEVVKLVEDNNWQIMGKMPRETEAQKMLHKYRQKWEIMSVITNGQGQKLILWRKLHAAPWPLLFF